MRGVNKAIVVGSLGRDPEVAQLPSGAGVTTVRVATADVWKDQSGEQHEKTDWHTVVLYGKVGEIAAQYLRKGSKVYIEGQMRTRSWEKEGQKHYATEIVAREMQMLGDRKDARPDAIDPTIDPELGEVPF